MQNETIAYKNEMIKKSFVKRDDIMALLTKFKEQVDLDSQLAMQGVPIMKSYKQALFVKLNTVYRRQPILDETDAYNFYNAEPEFTFEQVNLFYDIIDYANDKVGILYVPDRITVASFFRVNIDVWDMLINGGGLNYEIAQLFKAVDEYLISSATTGVEVGVLKNTALKRLEMKNRFGGHGVEYSYTPNDIIEASTKKMQSIRGKLSAGGKYNFIEAKEVNEEKEPEEIKDVVGSTDVDIDKINIEDLELK